MAADGTVARGAGRLLQLSSVSEIDDADSSRADVNLASLLIVRISGCLLILMYTSLFSSNCIKEQLHTEATEIAYFARD